MRRFDTTTCTKWLGAVAIAFAAALLSVSAWAVTGAVSTTTNPSAAAGDGPGHCKNGNEAINCNIYDGKQFVWLSGLPDSAQVNDGTYLFAVLVPGGQGGNNNPNDCTPKNLSDDPAAPAPCTSSNTGAGDAWTHRVFSIAAGVITYPAPGYQGGHDFDSNKIRLMPYDNTTNQGGVYIMATCKIDSLVTIDPVNPPGVDASLCKYDAFKVQEAACAAGDPTCCDPNTDPACVRPELGEINVHKFCDLNETHDATQLGLSGWAITFAPDPNNCSGNTGANGQLATCSSVTGGLYDVSETLQAGWTHTATCLNGVCGSPGDNPITVLVSGDVTDIDFGNVQHVSCGNVKTLGFWSNQNGRAILGAHDPDWRNRLNAANLVNADGSAFDIDLAAPFCVAKGTNPCFSGAYATLRTWLLNGTATNMAYMLSVQMATTILDKAYQGGLDNFNVSPVNLLAPLPSCARVQNLITGSIISMNALIGEANIELAEQGGNLTTSAGTQRSCEEAKKIIFDSYNNSNDKSLKACNTCGL